MQKKYHENLAKHTTIRIGGVAKEYIIPESIDELLQIYNERENLYYIGGGSNLLIANHEFDCVIDLKQFNNEIQQLNGGRFKVGASVRLQKLINQINKCGYGGLEYLYSVPGLVGGAVVMNAGRGRAYNKTISDYIVSVEVIRNGRLETVLKEKCRFGHRCSIFKGAKDIIVSVIFEFPAMPIEESEKLKKARIDLCKHKQDNSHPNFGSVFSKCNPRIMNLVRMIGLGKNVHFSKKTPNWILNEGGTFEEAVNSIQFVERIHQLFKQNCEREVIIWR